MMMNLMHHNHLSHYGLIQTLNLNFCLTPIHHWNQTQTLYHCRIPIPHQRFLHSHLSAY